MSAPPPAESARPPAPSQRTCASMPASSRTAFASSTDGRSPRKTSLVPASSWNLVVYICARSPQRLTEVLLRHLPHASVTTKPPDEDAGETPDSRHRLEHG